MEYLEIHDLIVLEHFASIQQIINILYRKDRLNLICTHTYIVMERRQSIEKIMI